jgi:hypothetical protein
MNLFQERARGRLKNVKAGIYEMEAMGSKSGGHRLPTPQILVMC